MHLRLGALLLALHMLFITTTAYAQTPPAATPPAQPSTSAGVVWSGPASGGDVVFLKDGQQIRGTLTELRIGESAVIQLPQGQHATIKWEGIAKIERNGQPIPMDAKAWQPPSGYSTAPAPAPVLPETMPYNSDKPIPAGYHLETKPRLGLVITGSILTGIGVLGIIAVESGSGDRDVKTAADVILGILFLGPGIPLLLVGLLSPKKTLRKDSAQNMWNAPLLEKQPFQIGFGPTKGGGGLLTIGRQF